MHASSQIYKGILDYHDLYWRFHFALIQQSNGFNVIGWSGSLFQARLVVDIQKMVRYTMTHNVSFILRRFS